MTAHAMKGDEARCLAAGMHSYVSKPFHVEELLEVIERHLDVSSRGRVPVGASPAAG